MDGQRPPVFPEREGFGAAREIARGPVLHQLRYSQAASLQDLLRDYTFFSHGLFFGPGGMHPDREDPLQDFVNHHPDPDFAPLVLDFAERPLFAGMGSPLWNQRLIGVENAVWPAVQCALSGVSAIDRNRRRFWLAQWQTLEILDPLLLTRLAIMPSPLPTVPVHIFGVDATDGRYLFPPLHNLMTEVPAPVMLPARAEVIRLGRQLLGTDNPAPTIEEQL